MSICRLAQGLVLGLALALAGCATEPEAPVISVADECGPLCSLGRALGLVAEPPPVVIPEAPPKPPHKHKRKHSAPTRKHRPGSRHHAKRAPEPAAGQDQAAPPAQPAAAPPPPGSAAAEPGTLPGSVPISANTSHFAPIGPRP